MNTFIEISHDALLFGYNRVGYKILQSFEETGKTPLIIDYNPLVIEKLSKKGVF